MSWLFMHCTPGRSRRHQLPIASSPRPCHGVGWSARDSCRRPMSFAPDQLMGSEIRATTRSAALHQLRPQRGDFAAHHSRLAREPLKPSGSRGQENRARHRQRGVVGYSSSALWSSVGRRGARPLLGRRGGSTPHSAGTGCSSRSAPGAAEVVESPYASEDRSRGARAPAGPHRSESPVVGDPL